MDDIKEKLAAAEKQAADLKAENAKLLADREEAGRIIADLKTEAATAAEAGPAQKTVKIDKKSYLFVDGDFTYKGQLVTHELLTENAKLAAELVREGVSHLQELSK